MRSVPEPSSVAGGPVTGRDPWAGFGAGPSSRTSRPGPGGNGAGGPDDERAVVDLARRLQDRVDGQEALLDRVADLAQRADDRARMSELRDTSRRMRRDSEALLLLCGADPGVHRGASHTVPSVLGDAVGLADEPSRVVLRPAPGATLAGPAAVELRHLVAELVDEAAEAAPGARIEVGARLEPDGALAVEVLVAGRGWTDGLGGARRSAFGAAPRLAERLARRSTRGMRLERPPIDQAEGLVATVVCPAALVTAPPGDDPWRLSALSSAPSRPAESRASGSRASGSYASGSYAPGSYAQDAFGSESYAPTYASESFAPDSYASEPYAPEPYAPEPYAPGSYPSDPYPSGSYPSDPYPSESFASGSYPSGSVASDSFASDSFASGSYPSGSVASDPFAAGSLPSRPLSRSRAPGLAPSAPGADTFLLGPPPARSGGDELFGPLPAAVGAIGTPIFEEVASAWFRDDERVGAGDWTSPGDREWRAAAARAIRTDAPSTTSSGLPRRSPGDRLVPPPRAAQQPTTGPDERVPERVRDRLATYQRGLQQGRHRAADPAQVDPAGAASEAWTADGW